MKRWRWDHPYLLLTLTVLFWSGNWVVGRGFRGEVPPVALAFWRWTIAFACTLPFAWPHRRQIGSALRAHAGILVLLGVLGIAGYNTLTYIGLRSTTATNGVLLNSFIPVVIIGLSWAFLGKHLRANEVRGVLLSLCGVTVIVAHGDWHTLRQLSLNPGDLWILASVLVWALYTLLLQFRPKDLHPMALLCVLTGIGVLGLAPLYAWELGQGLRIHPSPAAFAGILYTGLLPGFLGYVFWNRAVAEVGGNVSGLFIHLMPVFTPLLSALFLDETPQAYHFAGMALILGGILLTTRRQA
ncbi:DMT family transporter [Niveibacterium sp. SC-1]|uniref:DMT family transporter n=1 Tax=Niveibacterium sp. SC-1 TaxID=3135646 RepID=UPI00311E0DAC